MRSLHLLLPCLGLLPLLGACKDDVPELDGFRLPAGFSIEVLVDGLPGARSLAVGPSGTLFVSTRHAGKVYAVTGLQGGSPRVLELASGLNNPNGIAVRDGDLFVAEISRILRYPDIETRLDSPPEPLLVYDGLPGDHHHGWRFIDFGPDDKLYVAIGAPCNICDEPGYASIIRMNPDGSDREVYAQGVRNSVGFDWHPQTGELWFTDNGRDWMGDDMPPCELNHAPRPGMHFGYPYCHGDGIVDPEFGAGKDCSAYTTPAQSLGPHVAPLGLEFYDGEMFPPEYRMQVFIAEHGSWNRSEKIGYRVSLVRIREGRAVSYEPFVEGWLKDGKVSGRPVDLLTLADGSLLVSDDQGGRLYRISYEDR